MAGLAPRRSTSSLGRWSTSPTFAATATSTPSTGRGSVEVATEVAFVTRPEAGWTVATTLRNPKGRRRRQAAVVTVFRTRSPCRTSSPATSSRRSGTCPACAPWSRRGPNLYEVTCELLSPTDEFGRDVDASRRSSPRRGRRSATARQRSTDLDLRRQPPRPPSRSRQGGQRRRHPRRPAGDAGAQHHRRPHLPLPQRQRAVRPVRRVGDVRRRRGQHREPRLQHQHLRRRPVPRGVRGARCTHGAARPQPSVASSCGASATRAATAPTTTRWQDGSARRSQPAAALRGWRHAWRRNASARSMPNWVVAECTPATSCARCTRRSRRSASTAPTASATRPLIMCEYSHAMGNSNGSLADYWDDHHLDPGPAGWVHLGVEGPRPPPHGCPTAATRLAYGGDFGETPHDGNFVADGLMSADLEPHPAMREVAWVYRPVTVSLHGGGADACAARSTNRRSFVGLDDLVASWELFVDGDVAKHGRLQLPKIGAAATRVGSASVRGALPARRGASHRSLALAARHLVRAEGPPRRVGSGRAACAAQLGGCRRRLGRRTAVAAIDDLLVCPSSCRCGAPPTDNDGFKLMPELSERLGVGGQALRLWKEAGLPGHARRLTWSTTGAIGQCCRWWVGGDVPASRVEFPSRSPTCRVSAFAFSLPGRFRDVRWFGRGPHENYPDRKSSAMLGVWAGNPDLPPYLVPQEFGLRTDARWLECTDPLTGDVLRVDVLQPIALHMSGHQLPRRGSVRCGERGRSVAARRIGGAPRCRPSRPRHRQLRPRRAAPVPPSRRRVQVLLPPQRSIPVNWRGDQRQRL